MVYLFRWPDRSISFIEAKSKREAQEKIQDIGDGFNPHCHIEVVRNFSLDFKVKFHSPDDEECDLYGEPGGCGGHLIYSHAGQLCQDPIWKQIEACAPGTEEK